MKTNKVSKEFDQKLLALWEQCIDWKKKDVEYSRKHNKEMVNFHKDVLSRMEKQFQQIKKEKS